MEHVDFIAGALSETPDADMAYMLEAAGVFSTRAGFSCCLLAHSTEVTDRAHAIGLDVSNHRYFTVPLYGEVRVFPLSRLHPTTKVYMRACDGRVRPHCEVPPAYARESPECVVRVSRGNNSWYVTALTPGPLVSREPATSRMELAGRTMTAAEAVEHGFAWVTC